MFEQQEEVQPPEWEALLPSMDQGRSIQQPSDLAADEYASLREFGRRRLRGEWRALGFRTEEAFDAVEPAEPPAPRPWEREDVELWVRRLLRLLPDHESQVVRMRWGIGRAPLTQVELCAELGIQRTAAWVHEQQAIHRMRRILGVPDNRFAEPEAAAEGRPADSRSVDHRVSVVAERTEARPQAA